MWVYVNVFVFLCVCLRVCVCLQIFSVCVFAYVCACVHICMCCVSSVCMFDVWCGSCLGVWGVVNGPFLPYVYLLCCLNLHV